MFPQTPPHGHRSISAATHLVSFPFSPSLPDSTFPPPPMQIRQSKRGSGTDAKLQLMENVEDSIH